jgi:hypothetical protein
MLWSVMVCLAAAAAVWLSTENSDKKDPSDDGGAEQDGNINLFLSLVQISLFSVASPGQFPA